ncbi:hypothetical protein ACIBI9_60675 [Nonomuraea sp. NPDC050451]|uniref:hypothetical protein n=1 Tax=Nonomuraea sp. NPDC050451 TaxID=3364364 RepID=UPI00379DC338
MSPRLPARLFAGECGDRLRAVAGGDPGPPLTGFATAEERERLARARVLLTGWGSPVLDEAALAGAPHLVAVVHAAGSVKAHVTPPCSNGGSP